MKFPTEHRVREVKGNQTMAQECYSASPSYSLQEKIMMVNKEKVKKINPTVEPAKDLLEVLLDSWEPDQKVRIRSLLGPDQSKELIKLLA